MTKNRKYVATTCPSCSTARQVRADTLKGPTTPLCRSCANKAKPKKDPSTKFNRLDHYHTIEGHITSIWNGQKQRSAEKGWPEPAYAREELIEWVKSQSNCQELYQTWKDMDYAKNYAPSIDRLDDYKPYSFNNIRLVDWDTNNTKGRESQITGINTKNCKAVRQLTLDGVLVKEFHSVSAAARTLGISDTKICEAAQGYAYRSKGVRKNVLSASGYKWEYI
mgnify:FL=1